MENGNDVNWQDLLAMVLESARVDGYAVVGFALRPTDNHLMQINNQAMEPLQFLVFINTAQRAFLTTLPWDTLQKLAQATEA